ncbi:MAG: hypothetical protein WCD70_01125 [Alphaproteobacteria bacterium]
MLTHLIPICRAVHPHASLWPLVAGGALGCVIHCAGVCALCVSGGTAAGTGFYKTSRLAAEHLLPALFVFGGFMLSSHVGGFC